MRLSEHLSAHRPFIAFLVRYGAAGLAGALTQTLILILWVSVLGLKEHYLTGVVLGYSVAVVLSFALQKYWTFRDRAHHRAPQQLFLYTLFSLLNLGLTTILLHSIKQFFEGAGVDYFSGWYVVAQIAVIGIIALMSFVSNRYVTFRHTPH